MSSSRTPSLRPSGSPGAAATAPRALRLGVLLLLVAALLGLSAPACSGDHEPASDPPAPSDNEIQATESALQADAVPPELRAVVNATIQAEEPPEDSLIAMQQQKLLPSDPTTDSAFGRRVVIDGNTALVAAPYNDTAAPDAGAVYVFVKSGNTWVQTQKLQANDGAENDYFGLGIALDGDTAFIAAPLRAGGGGVYVFTYNGASWVLQQVLTASDAAENDIFGVEPAIEGNVAVIGASRNAAQGPGAGAAYVFVKNGGLWAQQQKLLPSDGGPDREFGLRTAVNGGTIFVGAPAEFGAAAGAVYTFTYNGALWVEQQKLTASDGAPGEAFGYAVWVDGSTAIIGALFDDDQGAQSGSAYVFVKSGTTWAQQQKLLPSDGLAGDQFGFHVSLEGDTAVITAPYDDELFADAGSAYIFVRSGGLFSQQQKITQGDPAATDGFGWWSAIQSGTLIIGAPAKDQPAMDAGAAYVFTVQALSNGSACSSAMQCSSGLCVDGVCCNTACGNGVAGDCQACSVAAGAAVNGTCSVAMAGTVCRGAAGSCDIPETCDGASTLCPGDGLIPGGAMCRAAAGPCDAAEVCSGASPACPGDALLVAGSVCRAAASACDAAEACTGASAACPPDVLAPAGTECRAAAGTCDAAETCTGLGGQCPPDTFFAAGTICRGSAGQCDAAETCTGASAACPSDAFSASGTVCRPAAGACDAQEACDGATAECPADLAAGTATVCRPAVGPCDLADKCDGVSKGCPADGLAQPGVVCRAAAGPCDVPDTCTGLEAGCPADLIAAPGTECRTSTGECDPGESCDGLAADCPADAFVPDGKACAEGVCKGGECGAEGSGGGGGGNGSGGNGSGGEGNSGGGAPSGSGGSIDTGEEGGCGCRVVGGSPAAGDPESERILRSAALLGGLLAIALRARRRRASVYGSNSA